MTEQEPNIAHIEPRQTRMRKRLNRVLALPLRREVEVVGDGLQRAEDAAREGAGTIIIWNHFSKRDGFDAGRIVAESPVWADRPSVFPVALNQQSPVFPLLEKHAGYTYPYIVTEDTLEHAEYQDHELGEGMAEFITASRDAISKGGTASVAFQGGRRPFLDMNDDKVTISKLVASMELRGITKFGILLVGFGEKRRKHYAKDDVGGLRIGKTKEVKIGPYFTFDELKNHPDIVNGPSKRWKRNIDPFIRSQFTSLVPEAYLHPPTDESREAQKRADNFRKGVIITAGALATDAAYKFYSSRKRR